MPEAIDVSLLINAAVKSINQLRGSDAEGLRYSQKRSYGYRSASLDLLPMPGRKTKTNHVFLRVAMTLAQCLDATSQRPKKLSLINHPFYLENRTINAHEQNSCDL